MSDTSELSTVPQPIEVGPEMTALRRFFPDVTWNGTIRAGGMGPGTPEMRGVGRASMHPIQDGRWLVGEFEQDQFLGDGTFVLRWQLHWVVGWSPESGAYRATIADSYGHADVYEGRIEGEHLVFESRDGAVPRLRLTWVLREQGDLLWRNEMSVDGAEWMLIEDYEMAPV